MIRNLILQTLEQTDWLSTSSIRWIVIAVVLSVLGTSRLAGVFYLFEKKALGNKVGVD